MIRQIAVAVLSAGALAACVPYGDGMMTPFSTGYANPMTQAMAAATSGGYGGGYAQPNYGYRQPGYGYGNPYYGAAPAPVYMPPPQPQVIYMPQQAAVPHYGYGRGYGYGGGRGMAPGMHRAGRDRDGNGVPDWRERDRNGDGTPDYQQRGRRFR